MAIIIEEEKKRINWFALAVVIALVAVAGVVIYYLFFSPLPLIEKVIPERLQSIKTISTAEFRPEAILEHSTFRILKQYLNQIELPPSVSPRSNPFLP